MIYFSLFPRTLNKLSGKWQPFNNIFWTNRYVNLFISWVRYVFFSERVFDFQIFGALTHLQIPYIAFKCESQFGCHKIWHHTHFFLQTFRDVTSIIILYICSLFSAYLFLWFSAFILLWSFLFIYYWGSSSFL